ncbi:zinc finger domain-containing protein [Streptomyces virens]|uniref:zinc finger domain-containing protein n=1 Tax=Streptomyces virens TaxID=285572 RepID=UPI003D154027
MSKCGAQPGSPCRSRGGAVASAYHTRRFTMVPARGGTFRAGGPVSLQGHRVPSYSRLSSLPIASSTPDHWAADLGSCKD